MTFEDDPQETGQDIRETIREEYLKETVESPDVEDAPINDIEPKEAEQVEEVAEIEESDEAVEEAAEVVEEPIELPELTPNDLWPKEFKEKFPNMPRDAQQFLIDTHREMQKGLTQKFTDLAEQRKSVEAIEGAFQPLEQFARVNGMQTSQIAMQAAQHIQNIIQDPIPGTKAFIKAMGVDINQLLETEEYIDPQVSAANQQVQQLQQRLNQFEQAQVNQGLSQAQAELNNFINETNEQGHLKHPRFEELRPYMHMFYQNDVNAQQPNKSLAEYYAMSEHFVAAQTPQSDPQRTQEPKANPVQKAKVASKNIKSKTNTKAPAKLDMREEIRQKLRSGEY